MGVTAIGFDLDYTLVVPERNRATLLDRATTAVDGPAISRDEYLATHRQHLTAETRAPIFEDILSDRDVDLDPEALTQAYRTEITNATIPVEQIEPMLVSLKEHYQIGLLTNGPRVAQWEKLVALGWRDLFDAVVISGDIEAGKPDTRAFTALLDALGVEPAECVYVGDDPEMDIGGAVTAGIRVIQVLYPGGPPRDPRASSYIDRTDLSKRLPDVIKSL